MGMFVTAIAMGIVMMVVTTATVVIVVMLLSTAAILPMVFVVVAAIAAFLMIVNMILYRHFNRLPAYHMNVCSYDDVIILFSSCQYASHRIFTLPVYNRPLHLPQLYVS